MKNIWFGGAIAVFILMIFLRSPRATLVVGLAIPVSVVASFVAMAMLGRSINVVSLAGIAFAVGMVVDAAIVVLENIYRMREQEGAVCRRADRCAAGLGRNSRLGADDGDGVHSASDHGIGSGPVVPGYRRCDFRCGLAVTYRLGHGYSRLGEAIAGRSSSGAGTDRACRSSIKSDAALERVSSR